MTSSSVASLLVAALAVLGRPCPRNAATARLLLQRASRHAALSPAERETCRDLAEALDVEAGEQIPQPQRPSPARALTDWGPTRRQQLLRQRPRRADRRVPA